MNLQKNKLLGSLYSHAKGNDSYLTVIDNLPFEVKRVFWSFHDKDDYLMHGNHAHKSNKQLLVCLSGQFKFYVTERDGTKKEFTLFWIKFVL